MEKGKTFYLKRTIDVFTQNVIEEVKESESADGAFDIQFDKDTYKYFQQEQDAVSHRLQKSLVIQKEQNKSVCLNLFKGLKNALHEACHSKNTFMIS